VSDTPKAVDVSDLWVKYGDTVAVRGIDLCIGSHQVFGLIGPNGAGKTSTLRCLAGLIEPSSGTVRIAGTDLARDPVRARMQMGFVPDFFGVYEHLEVWEYLEFFAIAQGLAPARVASRIDRMLALVGLEPKRTAAVETLSRGMRQRLCIARGLIHEPRVLLLDEPLSGLDAAARNEDLGLLRRLATDGCTIVLSSHILSDLAQIATSVGVLEQGRLVHCGPVDEVRSLVRSTRTIRLRMVPEAPDPVVNEVLARCEGIARWARSEAVLEVELVDDDETVARALDRLRDGGVRFIPASSTGDLEEAFLALSRGQRS
jgi:ABC-2 type transport system ATP-binding protein